MSECKGKIIAVGQVRSGEGKKGKWTSQQWVVEEQDAKYPQQWVLETLGEDKIKQFDIHEGEIVEVKYDAKMTEKDGRYYGTNRAWQVDKE